MANATEQIEELDSLRVKTGANLQGQFTVANLCYEKSSEKATNERFPLLVHPPPAFQVLLRNECCCYIYLFKQKTQNTE